VRNDTTALDAPSLRLGRYQFTLGKALMQF
jgi:hypothetical protein